MDLSLKKKKPHPRRLVESGVKQKHVFRLDYFFCFTFLIVIRIIFVSVLYVWTEDSCFKAALLSCSTVCWISLDLRWSVYFSLLLLNKNAKDLFFCQFFFFYTLVQFEVKFSDLCVRCGRWQWGLDNRNHKTNHKEISISWHLTLTNNILNPQAVLRYTAEPCASVLHTRQCVVLSRPECRSCSEPLLHWAAGSSAFLLPFICLRMRLKVDTRRKKKTSATLFLCSVCRGSDTAGTASRVGKLQESQERFHGN